MKKKIAKSDIFHWANTFITELKYLKKLHYLQPRLHTNHSAYLRIQENYRSSRKRLLVFDYDGTLVPLVKDPKTAKPDSGLQQLLNRLSNDDQNTIVISSGRTHTNLEEWLGEMKIILHAEHGLFSREPNKDWTQLYNAESKWKKQLEDILLTITKLIPGSSIEEKPFSIAWHYRNSGKNISTNQIFEISNELQKAIKGQGLEIIHGNKILEIKSSSINKGKPIEKLLSQEKYDFIMAIGDDTTDEEIFKVLDPDAFTIKVGADITRAKYFINSPEEVREMLGTLSSSYVTSRNNIFSV